MSNFALVTDRGNVVKNFVEVTAKGIALKSFLTIVAKCIVCVVSRCLADYGYSSDVGEILTGCGQGYSLPSSDCSESILADSVPPSLIPI